MATPNPLSNTYSLALPPVSKKTYAIAGIKTIVYGLDELPAQAKNVACLWLLHPRLSKQESMEPIAAVAITDWNQRISSNPSKKQGLIAVSFDQRNHGTRLVNDLANEAWRNGNPKHAQDMFSCFHGTSLDTSQLITYLPAYIFPDNSHSVTSHTVLGVSLGGHAAWHCLLHDARITTAVIIIGCADYTRLMQHRAMKSKLATWTSSSPPGATFLGSTDFPRALQEAVDRYDPAGLLMGEMIPVGAEDYAREPSEREQKRLFPLMRDHLGGKRLFNLAGGADKLVPYPASEPFLGWLRSAIQPGGWFAMGGVVMKDNVYEGVGHEMTEQMMKDSIAFVLEGLEAQGSVGSKI